MRIEGVKKVTPSKRGDESREEHLGDDYETLTKPKHEICQKLVTNLTILLREYGNLMNPVGLVQT